MLPDGLWCALAGLYSAGQGTGLALACPSWLRAHISTYLSIPEVPTPLGLLSSLSGMGIVISVSIDIPRYLGIALVAREGHGRLPLFHFPLCGSR